MIHHDDLLLLQVQVHFNLFSRLGFSSSATKNHLQIEMEFAHKLSSKDEQVANISKY